MNALTKNVGRSILDAFRYVTFGFSQRRGVYESFADAEAAAGRRRIGYNHRDLALKYRAELNLRLDVSDYPVLYHLKRIANSRFTVLDFGGNVGTHYLRYRKYLDPAQVNWIVCDLPEITRVGQEVCIGMSNIAFVNDVSEVGSATIDVFLACGSLQYLRIANSDLLLGNLMEKDRRPAHLLFDQMALSEGRRFVTLENGGLVRSPHYVYNRIEFIESIAKLGYELVDDWNNSQGPYPIPFHREKAVQWNAGLYFTCIS